MADRRKLQGEIDRCLKKVSEGVEVFEDIWKKVQQATNSNQKEKYETDLKREIKKLQRLRDQIKSWVANSDIKDKSTLLDHRKLIETQMERFKVVERETKTKAYSKEGLGAAAKLDPQTKEKGEITNWLSHMIDNLNVQLDQFESELETLTCTSKRKKTEHEKLDELKSWQDRHKVHIQKLEMVMRMVDNDAITPDQIKKIKDDVEYYVESNQEPDFEENMFVYDDLDLEEIGENGALQPSSPPENEDAEKLMTMAMSTPTSTNSSSPSPSPSVNHSTGSAQSEVCVFQDKSEEVERKRHKSQPDEKLRSNQSLTPTITMSNKQTTPSKQTTQSNPHSQNSDSSSSNHHPTTPTPPLTAYAAAASSQNSAPGTPIPRLSHSIPSVWGQRNASAHSSFLQDAKPTGNSLDHVAAASSATTNGTPNSVSTSVNSVSVLNSSGNPSVPSAPSPLMSGAAAPSPIGSTNSTASSTTLILSQSQLKTDAPLAMNGPLTVVRPSLQSRELMSSLKSMAQQAIVEAGLESQIPTSHVTTDSKGVFLSSTVQAPPSQPTAPSPEQTIPSQQSQSVPTSTAQQPSVQQQQQAPQTTTIHLNPLLGVAPLGPMPLSKEHYYQLSMLEAAFHHLPHPSDSERLRHYLPRNPCPTPSYYPQVPPPHADSVEFFQRLSTETLFFIFYYMEGTKAQYLAAKALKKQSWRFHTKYMMWFQRHEEPKTITEDYEQGTYIYFDYEKWGQRKKEGFTFEYRYLEDRDLN
ncbi:CCR4-NOT transcription complex subunit 3-like isoform X1 [Haliotis rufescens]|uniref:CCR4-NOT transcription complex subunit 3-like isoform X1 n=1 Tax=Haliotis rufescens TaxID=6454 RepID=UPI001EB0AED7|nr:CCR4-NOT transcription complex subunit 3-like isoform X1 [Haliotis rufescens]